MATDPGHCELENKVIDMLLAGDDPVLATLRAQYQAGPIAKRMFSGVGFFSEFSVPDDAPRADVKSLFFLSDIRADINGKKAVAGFHIQVKGGRLKLLEGFSFDEAWPMPIQDFTVHYAYPAAVVQSHPERAPGDRILDEVRRQWQA